MPPASNLGLDPGLPAVDVLQLIFAKNIISDVDPINSQLEANGTSGRELVGELGLDLERRLGFYFDVTGSLFRRTDRFCVDVLSKRVLADKNLN